MIRGPVFAVVVLGVCLLVYFLASFAAIISLIIGVLVMLGIWRRKKNKKRKITQTIPLPLNILPPGTARDEEVK
jgi:ABC-type spermidine/putrescine transport system permease subunit II